MCLVLEILGGSGTFLTYLDLGLINFLRWFLRIMKGSYVSGESFMSSDCICIFINFIKLKNGKESLFLSIYSILEIPETIQ